MQILYISITLPTLLLFMTVWQAVQQLLLFSMIEVYIVFLITLYF